jgi:signal transduction histidine kinase
MSCKNCEKLRIAEERAFHASDMERRRFSMDLHDDICQRLSGISMYCKSLLNSENPKAFLPEISELIDETVTGIKNYINDINPVSDEKRSLKDALEKLCRDVSKQNKRQIDFFWNVDSIWPRDPDIKINLYHIAQEALHNALKHSGAELIEVIVSSRTGFYTIFIRDNGRGDIKLSDKDSAGFGLNSIRRRADKINGILKIESENMGGTTITIKIPG